MPYADTLKVFDVLRENFEEKQAKTIAHAIEDALETNNKTILNNVATKADLADIKAELKGDLAGLKSGLEIKIADLRAELIKWMFIFWIGQMAVVFGIVKFVK